MPHKRKNAKAARSAPEGFSLAFLQQCGMGNKARSEEISFGGRKKILKFLSDLIGATPLREFAAKVGIPVSEYMRRLFFEGRPIIAKADDQAIKKLRRLGGLLKHHFVITRESGQQEAVREKGKTLQAIQKMMDNMGGKNDPEEI